MSREIVDGYLRKLKARLRGLPDAERDRIVLEIQTHLEGRAAAGAIQEAIDSFGPPEKLAQGFVDDFEATKARTPKTPDQKALHTAIAVLRYAGASLLGFLSLMLFMLGGVALLIAFLDMLYPKYVGMFVYLSPDGMNNELNVSATMGGGPLPRGEDVLGSWIILIGLGLAALLITLGVLIIRYLIWRLLFGVRRMRRGGGDAEA